MVLCVGEILADMIGAKTDDGVCYYERRAGGAPFNVACAVIRFGGRARFFGCVGDDAIGDFLIDFATKRGLDGCDIARSGTHNTTMAFVELDGAGERSFSFYRKNTADMFLPRIPNAQIEQANIIHIGSLMLSAPRGQKYAAELVSRAHSLGKRVSFDVNYRSDIFENEYAAVSAYKSIAEQVDIIKLSESEVGIFTDGFINERLSDKTVIISLGARGSEWRYKRRKNTVPTLSVTPVDTTGAGDAFLGGVLAKLDGSAEREFSDGALDCALAFGNACGALTTLGRGAIDALPSSDEAERAVCALINRG